jgi:uncharacterized protein YeaO (DUF488 family)
VAGVAAEMRAGGAHAHSALALSTMEEVAPSTELRRWFGHDPVRWAEFQRRYREELRAKTELPGELRAMARDRPLTPIYSAHDEQHNQAVVLGDLPGARRIIPTRSSNSPANRPGVSYSV